LKNSLYKESIDRLEIADNSFDVISKISMLELMRLVQQLSPVYRQVFTLFIVEGYSHNEIAVKLGIKEGTSKSNLRDARKNLQSLVKKQYPHISNRKLKFIKIDEEV
jgi:RNA polymerase sigma-70 factor (ECF subfamily)